MRDLIVIGVLNLFATACLFWKLAPPKNNSERGYRRAATALVLGWFIGRVLRTVGIM